MVVHVILSSGTRITVCYFVFQTKCLMIPTVNDSFRTYLDCYPQQLGSKKTNVAKAVTYTTSLYHLTDKSLSVHLRITNFINGLKTLKNHICRNLYKAYRHVWNTSRFNSLKPHCVAQHNVAQLVQFVALLLVAWDRYWASCGILRHLDRLWVGFCCVLVGRVISQGICAFCYVYIFAYCLDFLQLHCCYTYNHTDTFRLLPVS